MKERRNMNRYLKFSLVLLSVCILASGILAGVYVYTYPAIQKQNEIISQKAMKEVFGISESMLVEKKVTTDGQEYFCIYENQNKKNILGYIFQTVGTGYSGDINIMAGMTQDGTITGLRVITQSETPGLGARCTEVLKDETILDVIQGKKSSAVRNTTPWFMQRFEGKSVRELNIVKGSPKSGNDVQAITGATITSKAIMQAVKSTASKILDFEKGIDK